MNLDKKEKEKVIFENDISAITEKSEMGETLEIAFDDSINTDFKMSSIDLKSNINYIQFSGCTQLDVLTAIGFLPKKADLLSRQAKRNSVGVSARGRNDIVDISVGQRQQKTGMGMIDKMKGFFGSNKSNEAQK